jgi:hypothetical protein
MQRTPLARVSFLLAATPRTHHSSLFDFRWSPVWRTKNFATSQKGGRDDLKESKHSETENDEYRNPHPKAWVRFHMAFGNLFLGHDK